MDVGSNPIFWGFEEREKLMEFYERASGLAYAAYFRPGGVHQDLPKDPLQDIFSWSDSFPEKLDDLEGLLTENRIFKQRKI